ncbi:MAG: VOC family protein [Candidatus Thorarchaeota archaeon]
MITGIDIVFLHVKDSAKMIEWYKEKLGLDISFVSEDGSWTEFRFPENRSATRFAIEYIKDNSSEVEKQSIMVSFRVDDISKCIANLESKKIEFYGTPIIREEGSSLFATIKDPEGNWIQISQRK